MPIMVGIGKGRDMKPCTYISESIVLVTPTSGAAYKAKLVTEYGRDATGGLIVVATRFVDVHNAVLTLAITDVVENVSAGQPVAAQDQCVITTEQEVCTSGQNLRMVTEYGFDAAKALIVVSTRYVDATNMVVDASALAMVYGKCKEATFPEGVVCYTIDGVFYSAQTINGITIWQDENHVDVPAPNLANAELTCCPSCDEPTGAPVTVGEEGPPTEPSIEGAIHLVTDDGTATGTVLEQYIFDTESGVWIEMNRNAKSMLKFGTASPTSNGEWDGEEFFVTTDGTSEGEVLEQWIWDHQSTTWVQRPNPEFRTTSIEPVVFDTAWVGAQADDVGNLAKAVELSTGTILSSGLVTWTGHGLTIGETYYTSQTVAGAFVTPAPATGLSQALFTVIDANIIDVQVQEGVEVINDIGTAPTDFAKTVYVNATSPATATIFDLANPPVTNDNTLKNDPNNIYVGTDGSTWTYKTSTSTYNTYVYPVTAKHGVLAYYPAGQTITNGVVTNIQNLNTVSNTAGTGWNAATGVFTAQRAGWYRVTASLWFQASNWTGGSSQQVLIAKNGAYFVGNYTFAPVTITGFYMNSVEANANVYLAVGDTLRPQAYQNSGSNKLTAGGIYNTFSVVEIG